MCREVVQNIILKILEVQDIKTDVDLNQELEFLGFNSRCYIELVVQLEEFYDITIEDENLDFVKFKTINDICEMLRHYIPMN